MKTDNNICGICGGGMLQFRGVLLCTRCRRVTIPADADTGWIGEYLDRVRKYNTYLSLGEIPVFLIPAEIMNTLDNYWSLLCSLAEGEYGCLGEWDFDALNALTAFNEAYEELTSAYGEDIFTDFDDYT